MTDRPSAEPMAIAKEEAVKIEFVTLATEEQGHKVTLKETAEAQGQVEMFIGGSEFASIAKELGLIQPPRPLTHDVYLTLLDGLEVDFGRLEIYGLKDNAFLAKLFFSKKGQPEEMEIRPSDGLALALHHHLPIFLNRRLLKGTLSARDRETLEDLVKTVKF